MYRIAITSLLLLTSASWAQDVPAPGRGYKPLTPERRKELHAASVVKHGGRLAMLAKFQALPTAFDCRDKGWVLPVGDQGNCGSCYLYSTIYGTLTSTFVRAGYGKADGSFVMSVQFGMDCHDFGDCNGGNGTEVIDWAVKNGWPAEKWVDPSTGVAHRDYPPYEARSRACREVAGAKRWKPASWGFVAASPNRPATTLEIKTALYNYGPLNVSLDADGQFGSGTSTITSLGRNINHEIEVVAYDDAKDGGAFLLKNQWSTAWGDKGYRWVTYTAAQRLVDVFFVTASVLPPPPPVPPDPIPPVVSGKTLTLKGFGAADGEYEAHLPGTKALIESLQGSDQKLKDIQRILDTVPKAAPPEPKKDSPTAVPDRLPVGPEKEQRPDFTGRWRTAWTVYDVKRQDDGSLRLSDVAGPWSGTGWAYNEEMVVVYDPGVKDPYIGKYKFHAGKVVGYSCLASKYAKDGEPVDHPRTETWERVP